MISMNIPVGVSDFVEIRRNGYYYIDKTALIAELLKTCWQFSSFVIHPLCSLHAAVCGIATRTANSVIKSDITETAILINPL